MPVRAGAPAGVRALVGLFAGGAIWRWRGGIAREGCKRQSLKMLKSETLKSILRRGRDGGGLQFLEGDSAARFFHDGERKLDSTGVGYGMWQLASWMRRVGAGTELFFGGHGGGWGWGVEGCRL